jgi:hypothetical protein
MSSVRANACFGDGAMQAVVNRSRWAVCRVLRGGIFPADPEAGRVRDRVLLPGPEAPGRLAHASAAYATTGGEESALTPNLRNLDPRSSSGDAAGYGGNPAASPK